MVDELILVLLNEQNGYFHHLSGWNLNYAVIGAVLAELSLQSRIDTDMDSLHLVDTTETGDPILDLVLVQIAESPAPRNAHYWIDTSDLDYGLTKRFRLHIVAPERVRA